MSRSRSGVDLEVPEVMADPTEELSSFYFGADTSHFTNPDAEGRATPVIVTLDGGSERVVDRVRVVPTPNGEWSIGLIATWDPSTDGPLGRFTTRWIFPSSRILNIEVDDPELEHVHESSASELADPDDR